MAFLVGAASAGWALFEGRLRLVAEPSAEDGFSLYHCVSRVVDRQFVLGREEKDVFVRMMREYERFCGVRVLSYCIMSNHFHLLLEVPPKKKGEAVDITAEDFLARLKPMYSNVYYRGIEQMLESFRADGADGAAQELKAKFTCRMHDRSEFMKGLKQRFTQWYNGAHGRRGTLWEGRFKSVLVEDGYATRVMAAYIDYTGLWNDGISERYRMMLFADGEEAFAEDIHSGVAPEFRKGQRVRKGFRRKDVEKVLSKGGTLSFGETMRCRVRYFSDGMTVGSRGFVEKVFKKARDRFGKKRKSGARTMKGVGWQTKRTQLYSMRALVNNRLE